MDKILILAVGAVVAVGTVVYYMLREEPQRSRPNNGPSSRPSRSRSPPASYADINPTPGRKRKHVPKNRENGVVSSVKDTSNTSHRSEPDNMHLQYSESHVSSDPGKNQNDSEFSQKIEGKNTTISAIPSQVCEVCDEPANASLYPCKHRVFCSDHSEYYFGVAKELKQKAICPVPGCRQVIESYIV